MATGRDMIRRSCCQSDANMSQLRGYLYEMVSNVGSRRMYLWCAVDNEGEVLDLVMQREAPRRRLGSGAVRWGISPTSRR